MYYNFRFNIKKFLYIFLLCLATLPCFAQGSGQFGTGGTGSVPNLATPGPIGGTTPSTVTATTITETVSSCVTTPILICADQQTGADWSIQTNAAITALGSTPGTIDARGFTAATQIMSVSITVPTNTTLLLPCATIYRSAGIQFFMSNGSMMKGCGGLNSQTSVLNCLSGGCLTDTTPLIGQADSTDVNVRLEDIRFWNSAAAQGSGSIALNFPLIQRSQFTRLQVFADIGMVLGGTNGGCACYNAFYDIDWRGKTTALSMPYIGSPNSNDFYGGNFWGPTGIAIGSSMNNFFGIDFEGGSQVHAIDFLAGASGNNIYPAYVTTSGDITFESNSDYNIVQGGLASFNGGINDLSGNTTNRVSLGLVAPIYSAAKTGFIFGTRNDGPTGYSLPQSNAGSPTTSLFSVASFISDQVAGSGIDLNWTGNSVNVGYNGHATLRVGQLKSTSGQIDTGKVTISVLATPAAPTVVATGGSGTNWTYFVVCKDNNGGVTLPSAGTTVSGGATLSGSVFNTITPPVQDGCFKWDVLQTDTAHSILLNQSCGSGSAPCKDTGQAPSGYVAPVRNTTGDETISGNLTLSGLTASLPTCTDANKAITTTGCTPGSAHAISAPLNCSAASASGTAYTCTTSPTFVPADGDSILFEADVANTGAATLNVNSSAAKNIQKQGGGTALVANDILAGQDTLLIYDGTNWQMQGQVGNAPPTGISGLTTGFFPKAASSTTIANSLCDEGITTANVVTCTDTAGLKVVNVSTGTAPPLCTTGTAGALCQAEGTAPTAASAVGQLYTDSTLHDMAIQTNGGGAKLIESVNPSAINSGNLTGAVSTATLCASSAGACNQAGQYYVHFDFIETGTACGTPGTGGVTFLLTWTDANGTTHSAVSLGMDDASAINAVSQTFHFQTSLAAAWASGEFILSSNGSIIQYATGYTACGVGTGTYRIQASVTRLQ